jgi:hypothetical protein
MKLLISWPVIGLACSITFAGEVFARQPIRTQANPYCIVVKHGHPSDVEWQASEVADAIAAAAETHLSRIPPLPEHRQTNYRITSKERCSVSAARSKYDKPVIVMIDLRVVKRGGQYHVPVFARRCTLAENRTISYSTLACETRGEMDVLSFPQQDTHRLKEVIAERIAALAFGPPIAGRASNGNSEMYIQLEK